MLFNCYISILSTEGILEFIFSIIMSIVVVCMRLTMIYELNNKYYLLKNMKNFDIKNINYKLSKYMII
jgi:hypothetical protein